MGVPKKLVEGDKVKVKAALGETLREGFAEADLAAEAEGGALVGDTVTVRALEGDTESLLLNVSLAEPLSVAELEGLLVATTLCVELIEGVTVVVALRLAVPDTGSVKTAENESVPERQPEVVAVTEELAEAQGEAEAGGDPEMETEEHAVLDKRAVAEKRGELLGEPVVAPDTVRAPDALRLTVGVTDADELLDGTKDGEEKIEGELERDSGAEGLMEELKRPVALPEPDEKRVPLTLGLPDIVRVLVGEGVTAAEPVPTDGEGEAEARALSVTTVAVASVEPVRDSVGDADGEPDAEGVLPPPIDGVKVPVEHPVKLTVP